LVPQKRRYTPTETHGFGYINTIFLKSTAVTATRLTTVLILHRSGDYKDELVWGAVWLYRATNDKSYLDTAEQLYNDFGLQNWNGGFTWDSKISGVEVRLLVMLFTIALRPSLISRLISKVLNHRKTVSISVSNRGCGHLTTERYRVTLHISMIYSEREFQISCGCNRSA
jgi:hypothetical protein